MSGRKNALLSFKSIVAGDMSQATVVSSVLDIQFLDNIGMQFNVASGSPTGTITVEVSADYLQDSLGNVITNGNWITLLQPNGTPVQVSIVAGSPAQSYLDLQELSCPFIRAKYTRTSGSGSLNAFFTAKMI
jgi:hypothetical protein